MTPRVLVWPWHGRLSGGLIRLPAGPDRVHPSPANGPNDVSGPGDTHLIQVPGIPAITAEEAAQAPEGGQWWAGRALLSGTDLYGKRLNGWIYQATSGTKWWLALEQIEIGASSTTGRFRIKRFGLAGGNPNDFQLSYFELPDGRCSPADAARVFADLRAGANEVLRLHSVSSTGRHAVLALVVSNNVSTRPLDKRPRAYRFYLATVTGEGAELEVAVAPLYGIDQIAPAPVETRPSGHVEMDFPDAPVETNRTPYYESGVLVAYDVTYSLDSGGSLATTTSPTLYAVPGTYTRQAEWMLQVGFDGETPVPIYATAGFACEVPQPTLERTTIQPRILRERLAGGVDTLQNGQVRYTGSGTVSTVARVEVAAWAEDVTVSCSSEFDTGVVEYQSAWPANPVTNSYTLTSSLGDMGLTQAGGPERIVPVTAALLAADSSTRQPQFNVVLGIPGLTPEPTTWQVLLDLYSNNLTGLCSHIPPSPLVHLGAATRESFESMAGESSPGTATYGSYNPATGQAVIGALNPTNWI